MASARIIDVTAQDGLYLVQLYSVVTESLLSDIIFKELEGILPS